MDVNQFTNSDEQGVAIFIIITLAIFLILLPIVAGIYNSIVIFIKDLGTSWKILSLCLSLLTILWFLIVVGVGFYILKRILKDDKEQKKIRNVN